MLRKNARAAWDTALASGSQQRMASSPSAATGPIKARDVANFQMQAKGSGSVPPFSCIQLMLRLLHLGTSLPFRVPVLASLNASRQPNSLLDTAALAQCKPRLQQRLPVSTSAMPPRKRKADAVLQESDGENVPVADKAKKAAKPKASKAKVEPPPGGQDRGRRGAAGLQDTQCCDRYFPPSDSLHAAIQHGRCPAANFYDYKTMRASSLEAPAAHILSWNAAGLRALLKKAREPSAHYRVHWANA
jgi:hypothetical protein